jgi:hypothetical protein
VVMKNKINNIVYIIVYVLCIGTIYHFFLTEMDAIVSPALLLPSYPSYLMIIFVFSLYALIMTYVVIFLLHLIMKTETYYNLLILKQNKKLTFGMIKQKTIHPLHHQMNGNPLIKINCHAVMRC